MLSQNNGECLCLPAPTTRVATIKEQQSLGKRVKKVPVRCTNSNGRPEAEKKANIEKNPVARQAPP